MCGRGWTTGLKHSTMISTSIVNTSPLAKQFRKLKSCVLYVRRIYIRVYSCKYLLFIISHVDISRSLVAFVTVASILFDEFQCLINLSRLILKLLSILYLFLLFLLYLFMKQTVEINPQLYCVN